jgi:hypothetical protein
MLTLWHKFTTEDVRQRVEHWLAKGLVNGTKDASFHSVGLQLRVQHAASRMIEEGFLRYRNWEPRRAEKRHNVAIGAPRSKFVQNLAHCAAVNAAEVWLDVLT